MMDSFDSMMILSHDVSFYLYHSSEACPRYFSKGVLLVVKVGMALLWNPRVHVVIILWCLAQVSSARCFWMVGGGPHSRLSSK